MTRKNENSPFRTSGNCFGKPILSSTGPGRNEIVVQRMDRSESIMVTLRKVSEVFRGAVTGLVYYTPEELISNRG